jgi:hypothetical protein
MFECQLLNIHMLMKYLERIDSVQVCSHLIRKLRMESYTNLDLYLPQICYLVLTKTEKEIVPLLQKLVLEISMVNPNIGFRSLHYFQSWSEDTSDSGC